MKHRSTYEYMKIDLLQRERDNTFMNETIAPIKPKGVIKLVKDFCAPLDQPSWSRERLDRGAEKLNSCLRAANSTLDKAFDRVDKAINNDRQLPVKIMSGAVLAGLLLFDVEVVKGVMNLIAVNAPVKELSVIERLSVTTGLMSYLSAHVVLGRTVVGLSPILDTN